MNILFVTHAFPRETGDAAGSFLLQLAKGLGVRGVTVRVLAPAAPGFPPDDVVDGIVVTRFRYAPAGMETLAYTGTMAEQARGSVGGLLAMAGLLARGRAAVRREREQRHPDVVHAHWWFPGGLIARSQSGRTPFVTTLHGTDVRLAAHGGLGRRLFRFVARGSDRVTAVSRWLADAAQAACAGLDVSVAPMPVDVTQLLPAPAGVVRCGVLFVGRLNAQKGVADLIDAFARSTAPALLDIVGDGPDADGVRARALELGVGDRVRFHGALPGTALPTLYQHAGVVVLPSRDEGLGLVAVEAQLCGAPVIAYDSGGLRDVVQHDRTGLLVPPGERDALTAAIDAVLTTPALAGRLAEQGRVAALARFAPAAAAERYIQVYEQAIAQHAHTASSARRPVPAAEVEPDRG